MIQIYFKTGKSKKLEAVFMNADMYVPCVVALEKKAKKLGAELVEEFDEDFKILKENKWHDIDKIDRNGYWYVKYSDLNLVESEN